MSRALAALCLIACGRLEFGDTDGGDGSSDRPNVAFVTRATVSPALGGIEGADAYCANQASSAGLPGTFIALLSTSTVAARERVANSRGWVTTTNAPIADLPSDLFAGGELLGIIDYDERSVRLPVTALYAWTGSDGNGNYDPVDGSCGDWTVTTGTGVVGFYDRGAPYLLATAPLTCGTPAHLYCFEVGHVAEVTPRVSEGRNVFLTANVGMLGLAGFDAHCQSEATAAGLPGTYLAALATTTTTIASRFALTLPWRRVDGTLLALTADEFFTSSFLLSIVNQRADGSYRNVQFAGVVRNGAPDPLTVGTSTCADWTTTAGTVESGLVHEAARSAFWGDSAFTTCNTPMALLCMQQ